MQQRRVYLRKTEKRLKKAQRVFICNCFSVPCFQLWYIINKCFWFLNYHTKIKAKLNLMFITISAFRFSVKCITASRLIINSSYHCTVMQMYYTVLASWHETQIILWLNQSICKEKLSSALICSPLPRPPPYARDDYPLRWLQSIPLDHLKYSHRVSKYFDITVPLADY